MPYVCLGMIGIPTTVLIGLVVSLVIGIIISYFLGKLISQPIIKVTEVTKKTADLDLVADNSLEKVLKYKDESATAEEFAASTEQISASSQ